MSVFQRLKTILTWTNMSLVFGVSLLMFSSSAVPQMQTNFVFDRFQQSYKQKYDAARQRQLVCLARNVYYEAGNEPFKGQLAVAQVTVNRAHSGQFPRDLCDVISQSSRRGQTRVCQFSWYCDKTKNKNLRISESHPSYIAAKKVYLEGERLPKLGHSTYYFHNLTVTVSQSYPYKIIAKIGNHIFYRREKQS